MEWKWKYFSPYEMMCSCGCERFEMDDGFMTKLGGVCIVYNKPIVINSGYRCPDYNDKISKIGRTGPHTTGRAVDIRVSNPDISALVGISLDYMMLGFGFKQHGPHESRFLHLDDISARIWSY